MPYLEEAAALLAVATAFACVLIFDYARHDPKPPPPVRLADRSTWRREPEFCEGHWGHFVGLALALTGVALLIAAL